ncbi:MAG: hypothetical protein NTW66_00825 [Candidatus Magasanikbacteria bacterium]|nr:hypothetical protein [Candidatus Magasanikbacteria bacterium]
MADEKLRLSKEQKIGLVLLSAFVLLAVTLGLIQMRNTLYSPFALNTSIPPMIGQEVNTPEALRYRDTDMDGLSDYDELYIFTTSPYLADSDSDGLTDKQEIDQGKNPNCAEGKNCIGNVGESASTVAGKPDLPTLFDYKMPTTIEELVSSPEQMRTVLLNAGVEQSVIDKISDEELVQMAAEIFSSSTPAGDMTAVTSLEELISSPEQVRLILLEAGVEQSVLDKISDDDLIKMATEIFSSSTIMSSITTATNTANTTATAQFINEIMSGKKK